MSLPCLEVAREAAVVRVTVMRRNYSLCQLMTDDIRACVTEGSFRGRIPLENPAFMVDGDDAIERDLHDSGIANSLSSFGLLGTTALEEDAELEANTADRVQYVLIRRLRTLAVQLDGADNR